MNILGLDLSLSATGLCAPNGDVQVLMTGRTGVERLARLRSMVDDELRRHVVDVVVIEGYAFGAHDKGARSIGELGGVVRLRLFDLGLPFVEIPPSNLKKYATGKGNASKDAVLQAALIRSGRQVPFQTNDAADAFWLWQMGLAHYCPDSPYLLKMPKVNLQGLLKVPWVEIATR